MTEFGSVDNFDKIAIFQKFLVSKIVDEQRWPELDIDVTIGRAGSFENRSGIVERNSKNIQMKNCLPLLWTDYGTE